MKNNNQDQSKRKPPVTPIPTFDSKDPKLEAFRKEVDRRYKADIISLILFAVEVIVSFIAIWYFTTRH